MLAALTFTGCDSTDPGTEDGIYGQWLLANAYFFDVEPSVLRDITWSPSGECWRAVSEAPFDAMEGDEYQYRFANGGGWGLTLQGDQLVIRDLLQGQIMITLNRTSMEESDLTPRCTVP